MTAPDARQVIAEAIREVARGNTEHYSNVSLAALAAAVGSDGDFAVVDGKVRAIVNAGYPWCEIGSQCPEHGKWDWCIAPLYRLVPPVEQEQE